MRFAIYEKCVKKSQTSTQNTGYHKEGRKVKKKINRGLARKNKTGKFGRENWQEISRKTFFPRHHTAQSFFEKFFCGKMPVAHLSARLTMTALICAGWRCMTQADFRRDAEDLAVTGTRNAPRFGRKSKGFSA